MATVIRVARTKEFDPDAALDVATSLFWRNGYEGTSTADLVAATGVARASLYATFGGKHDLYLTCLDHYMSGGGRAPSPEQVVATTDDAVQAIHTLLRRAPEWLDSDRPPGCFSVNATVEHGGSDTEISRRLEADRQRLESAFHTAVLRAQRDGTIRADLDAATTARMLLSTYTGMLSLARAGADQRGRLDDTIAAVMALITT